MVQYRFYNLRVFLRSFVYNLQADFFVIVLLAGFPTVSAGKILTKRSSGS